MIEFDVLEDPGDGRLVLAHDYEDLPRELRTRWSRRWPTSASPASTASS